MTINNRVSSTSQPSFGSRVRRKENIKNHSISSAYKVDISNRGLQMLSELDDDVAIFNSDVLTYNKGFKLSFKFFM